MTDVMPPSGLEQMMADLADRLEKQERHTRRLEATLFALARLPADDADPNQSPRQLAETITETPRPQGTPYQIRWPNKRVAGPAPKTVRDEDRIAESDILWATAGLVHDPLIGIDSSGRIRVWNPAAEDFFGWNAEEVIGKFPPFLPDDKIEEHENLIADARAGKPAHDYPALRRRKDGQLIRCELSVAGAGSGVALTIRPLALPTPASAASLLQSDELPDPHAQGLIAVGKQVASIAHDFNNLLTIICGGLENLRDQFDEHDSRKAVIDLVEAASLRASDVTRGLLDLARFGSTTPNPEFLQCDLTAVTREYAPVLEGMLGPNRVLQLTVPDRPTDVPVDSVRIGQVLLNLTSNSRDAMPDGGTLTIRIERADAAILADGRAGPAAILTVSDTGFGMDSETLDQAFEPFFTTKPLGMGSGIGLSTVADIVRMAGGYIVPESHPGIGTTIQIALPLIETSLGIIPGSEIIET